MFKSLLLAVDINNAKDGARSTQAAVGMARQENAVLHVVNVVPDDGMPIVSSSLSKGHNAAFMESAKAELEAWAKDSLPEGVEHHLHVVRGTVYDQIIKLAGTLDVDGIFVGAHRPELKDYLIGPNAARVARHATQSVFVIR